MWSNISKKVAVRFVCCIGKCIETRRVTNETSGKSLKCRNWIEEKPEIYSIYTKYFPVVFSRLCVLARMQECHYGFVRSKMI